MEEPPEQDPMANATKRLRWATQRVPSNAAGKKRMSIMERFKAGSSEKKRESGGGDSLGTTSLGGIQEESNEAADDAADNEDEGQGPRKLFFNQPLPPELVDENGYPTVQYARNKIRTAKYTPLSFIPKNLWYQFHNIANIYFLFLIILDVGAPPAW